MDRTTIFRITDARFAETAFSGQGGLYAPGRWHQQGALVVYAATTSSLALLEWRVHTNQVAVERAYVLLEATLPTTAMEDLPALALPEDWQQHPPAPSTQRLGMRFLDDLAHLALRVPSAVNPREHNLLINPRHPDAAQIALVRTDPLTPDQRLW